MLSAVVAAFVLHLLSGPADLTVTDLGYWLIGDGEDQQRLILSQLRLPRALLAASVGACLAVCGCASQGLFRNPLADPSLIGVSAGASAGASLVIVFFASTHWQLFGLSLLSLGAFAGAISVVFFVYRLSSGSSGISVSTMLLAGIAFSYLAGSLASVLEFIADNDMLKRISLWRMGGLDGADPYRAGIMLAVTVVVMIWLQRLATPLNVLLLGESEARHLGFPVERLRLSIVICVALGVGSAVAMAGTIAFVGLVVPHLVRMCLGPDHHYLLPFSAGAGMILVLLADTLARTIIAPGEIPVGLIIAFIGAPIFISLLRRRHQYGMN